MTIDTHLTDYFDKNRERILDDYFALLRFPTISSDIARLGDSARCATWLRQYLRGLGFNAAIELADDQPLVIAERPGSANAPTVLFYGHYDVQPIEPCEQWRSDPFEPVLVGERVYARGAQDNKGQLFAFLTGVAALIASGAPLPPLRIILDSQEESGSGALRKHLPSLKRRLAADILLVCDTGKHSSGRLAITAGLRGLAHLTVHLTGASYDLHSGTHGGVAPNPALALTRMLATLHNADGSIAVEGFYDRLVPLTEAERRQAMSLPFDPGAYQRETGTLPAGGERGLEPVERGSFRPTIEINGLVSGHTGPGVKTIIPAAATAKLSMRLCPGQSPTHVLNVVSEHLRQRVPPGLKLEIANAESHGPGIRLPLDSPLMQIAADVLERMGGEPPAILWEGGSIPVVAALWEQTGAAPLLVGFGCGEDRVHAPNESFSLTQFREALRFSGLFLSELAAT